MVELIKELPPTWLFAATCIALVAFVVLIAVVVWAVLQGREVTLWPPKVGPRLLTATTEAITSNELPFATVSARPIAQLYVRDGHGPGRNYVITANHRHISAGRTQDNDIVLHDSRVSRVHFRIEIEPRSSGSDSERVYEFVLTDTGSPNGTFVNGQRVTRIDLPPKAQIQVGGAEVVFHNQS